MKREKAIKSASYRFSNIHRHRRRAPAPADMAEFQNRGRVVLRIALTIGARFCSTLFCGGDEAFIWARGHEEINVIDTIGDDQNAKA